MAFKCCFMRVMGQLVIPPYWHWVPQDQVTLAIFRPKAVREITCRILALIKIMFWW